MSSRARQSTVVGVALLTAAAGGASITWLARGASAGPAVVPSELGSVQVDAAAGPPGALRASPGAIRFAPGVTYPQALAAIYVARTTGALGTAMTVVPPLPKGRVVRQPSEPSAGITVDLAAPFGYRPSDGNAVIVPTIGQRGSLSADQVRMSWRGLPASRPWLAGAWLDVPILPDCMIARSRADAPMACTASDSVTFDSDRVSAPLP